MSRIVITSKKKMSSSPTTPVRVVAMEDLLTMRESVIAFVGRIENKTSSAEAVGKHLIKTFPREFKKGGLTTRMVFGDLTKRGEIRWIEKGCFTLASPRQKNPHAQPVGDVAMVDPRSMGDSVIAFLGRIENKTSSAAAVGEHLQKTFPNQFKKGLTTRMVFRDLETRRAIKWRKGCFTLASPRRHDEYDSGWVDWDGKRIWLCDVGVGHYGRECGDESNDNDNDTYYPDYF